MKAKALKVLTPDNDITQEIKVSGNDVTIITTTPMGTTETKAAVGEESSQSAIDGSPLKVPYICSTKLHGFQMKLLQNFCLTVCT